MATTFKIKISASTNETLEQVRTFKFQLRNSLAKLLMKIRNHQQHEFSNELKSLNNHLLRDIGMNEHPTKASTPIRHPML